MRAGAKPIPDALARAMEHATRDVSQVRAKQLLQDMREKAERQELARKEAFRRRLALCEAVSRAGLATGAPQRFWGSCWRVKSGPEIRQRCAWVCDSAGSNNFNRGLQSAASPCETGGIFVSRLCVLLVRQRYPRRLFEPASSVPFGASITGEQPAQLVLHGHLLRAPDHRR